MVETVLTCYFCIQDKAVVFLLPMILPIPVFTDGVVIVAKENQWAINWDQYSKGLPTVWSAEIIG